MEHPQPSPSHWDQTRTPASCLTLPELLIPSPVVIHARAIVLTFGSGVTCSGLPFSQLSCVLHLGPGLAQGRAQSAVRGSSAQFSLEEWASPPGWWPSNLDLSLQESNLELKTSSPSKVLEWGFGLALSPVTQH